MTKEYNEPFNAAAKAQEKQREEMLQLPASGLDELLNKPLGNAFDNLEMFEKYQRMAKLLATSSFVPTNYKGNLGDCVIALNLANRLRVDVLAVMQNLFVVHGKPAWSSKFMIAMLNASDNFGKLKFKFDKPEKPEQITGEVWDGKGAKKTVTATVPNWQCYAEAVEKETGDVKRSITVSMDMAVKEGWYHKPGSKWVTMAELMLQYRAASFFVNMHEPNLLMGIRTLEEMQDIALDTGKSATQEKGTAGLKQKIEAAPLVDDEFVKDYEAAETKQQ